MGRREVQIKSQDVILPIWLKDNFLKIIASVDESRGNGELRVQIGTVLEVLEVESILAVIIRVLNMHRLGPNSSICGHLPHSNAGLCAQPWKDRGGCCNACHPRPQKQLTVHLTKYIMEQPHCGLLCTQEEGRTLLMWRDVADVLFSE